MKEHNYAAGIWLIVKDETGTSKQRILKIGELEDLFPFAQMMQDHSLLSTWIAYKGLETFYGSLNSNYKKGKISYSYGTPSDAGREILKFLSLSKEEKKNEIERLAKIPKLQPNGEVRDNRGRLIAREFERDAILAQIEEKKKEIKKLKKCLQRNS